MSIELADPLPAYLREQTKHLESLNAPLAGLADERRQAFAHRI